MSHVHVDSRELAPVIRSSFSSTSLMSGRLTGSGVLNRARDMPPAFRIGRDTLAPEGLVVDLGTSK